MPKRNPHWSEAGTAAIQERQAEHDAHVLPRIRELREAGNGWQAIAGVLELDGLPTPRPGGTWTATAVSRIAKRHGIGVRRQALTIELSAEQAQAVGDLIAETLDHMANPPTAAIHHGDRLVAVRGILRRALVNQRP